MGRQIVTIVAVLTAAVGATAVAGCGGSPGSATTTIPDGTAVDPDRYLADVAAAARAVRDYAAEINALPQPATKAALQAAAPRLQAPLAAAKLAGQRLSAERLDDRRLEAQRLRSATAYASVVDTMERVATAASVGDPAVAATESAALNEAISTLQAVAPAP